MPSSPFKVPDPAPSHCCSRWGRTSSILRKTVFLANIAARACLSSNPMHRHSSNILVSFRPVLTIKSSLCKGGKRPADDAPERPPSLPKRFGSKWLGRSHRSTATPGPVETQRTTACQHLHLLLAHFLWTEPRPQPAQRAAQQALFDNSTLICKSPLAKPRSMSK